MKIKAILLSTLLAISSLATANVMSEMFQMNRELMGLARANTLEEFNKSADSFIELSKKAQATMPASLDDDQERFKGYQQAMQEVIDVVEQAKKLAEEGKLDEAKTVAEKLGKLKKLYHSEYK